MVKVIRLILLLPLIFASLSEEASPSDFNIHFTIPRKSYETEENDTIRKVMNAMLSMQRRAWEQGVASQALLELGEKELVILMAKDAVVNQKKDGRLGLNEGDRPVADPASNGEPVLFAASETGDGSLEIAADRMLEFLLYKAPRTPDGIIYHCYPINNLDS